MKTPTASSHLSGEPTAWNLLTYQNALTLVRSMRDVGIADEDRDYQHWIQQVVEFHDTHFVPVNPDTEMFIQHRH